MDIIQAIILSIVEGVTEFLPVSSTGHLVLTANLLKIQQTDFVKSFEIFIQLGAILAIVYLYRQTLLQNRGVWERVLAAFLPSAVIGFISYSFIKSYLIGNALITLLALFIGGILLIVLEMLYKEKEHHTESIEKLTFKQSLAIGFFQSIAMVPGVSRAAATIIGGLFMGAKRKTAVEFSFLLAIPTMLAATGLDLKESSFKFTVDEIILLGVGFVGSFLVAIVTVKWFLKYIQSHSFISFGIYRILLAIVYAYFFL